MRMRKTIALLMAALMAASIPFATASGEDPISFAKDFTAAKENDALPEGWQVVRGSASMKNGYLELGPYSTVALPKELSGASFTYEMDFTIADAGDSARWVSLVYRAQGEATESQNLAPYMQMCVRQNAAAASGVEVAYRDATNKSWNVVAKGSAQSALDVNEKYTAKAVVNGKRVAHYIDGRICAYYFDAKADDAGRFAIQSDNCKARVFAVRIGEAETVPDTFPSDADKIKEVYEANTGLVGAPTVGQEIYSADQFKALATAEKSPQVAAMMLADATLQVQVDGEMVPIAKAIEACANKSIPLFVTQEEDVAVAFAQYVRKNALYDVILASTNVQALQKAYAIESRAVRYAYVAAVSADSTIQKVARSAHEAGASIVIMQANEAATRPTLEYLQQRLLTVWIAGNSGDASDVLVKKAFDNGANGVFVADPAVAYGLYEQVKDTTLMRKSFFIGHRGLPGIAPENTVEGMLEAFKAGADSVENDVYVTTDNKLILNHNGTIDGYTTDPAATGSMESFTLEQLKSYTLKKVGKYDACKFATLDEQLAELKKYPDKMLTIEIKSAKTNIVPLIAEALEKYEVQDQVFFICFGTAQLEQVRKLMPWAGVGWLQSGVSTNKTDIQHLYTVMQSVGPIAGTYHPAYTDAGAAFVKAARHRGITVHPWTINDSRTIGSMINRGVGSITTDVAGYSKQYTYDNITAESILNPPAKYTLGDVNNDKKITGVDALWVLEHVAGMRKFTETQQLAANVNKDTKVTGVDALWILEYVADIRKEFAK